MTPTAQHTGHGPGPGRRSGRPPIPGVSRRKVARAGLELAEREGAGALTMRRLAAALDVSPMTLYGRVENREDLFDAMADELIGQIPLPGDGPWKDEARRYAIDARRMLARHPDVLAVRARRPLAGPAGLRAAESLIGLLLGAGLAPRDAALSYRALLAYVFGVALAGLGDNREAVAERVAGLPADGFPALHAVGGHLADTIDREQEFLYGLDLLLEAAERRGGR